MKEQRVFLTDLVRTPLGAPGGSLKRFMSSDLAAKAIRKLLDRQQLDPLAVDQVVFGQSLPSTMPNNIGHFAWLKAELPALARGAAAANAVIATGNDDIVMAGGADSYSAAPFVMRDVRLHFYPQDRIVIDSLDEAECCTQPEPMSRLEQYESAHGKDTAEEEAAFAAESLRKAGALRALEGDAVVPMSYVDRKKGEIVIEKDEWPGKAHEGPLSPKADGAAVALLAGEESLETKGLKPVAEILGFAVSGCDPVRQEEAGAPAAEKLLKTKGLKASDIALFEIKENSGADVKKTAESLNIPMEKVNPFGGAAAFGGCDGAEGLLMLDRLVNGLKAGELGVIVSHSAGGMGMAALIKKC